jgi:hypothetical protein
MAFLAQVAPAPALPAPSAEVAREIVVVGTRAKTWRGGLTKRDGKLVCRTRQSTGDREIDAMRCGAMLRCFAPRAAEMDRIAASKLPAEDKNRRYKVVSDGAVPCLEQADAVGIRLLAEQRKGQGRREGAPTR